MDPSVDVDAVDPSVVVSPGVVVSPSPGVVVSPPPGVVVSPPPGAVVLAPPGAVELVIGVASKSVKQIDNLHFSKYYHR